MKAEDTAGPVDTRPDAHLLNGPQLDGKGVKQNEVDDMLFMSAAATQAAEPFDMEFVRNDNTAPEADEPVTVTTSAKQLDAATIEAIFDETGDDFGTADEDDSANEVMDADSIAALFDTDTSGADAGEEASADAAWEEEEVMAAADDDDPLAMLSENERQALFS
jgi:hypothetical protein